MSEFIKQATKLVGSAECPHDWRPIYRRIKDCKFDGTDNDPIDWFCAMGCGTARQEAEELLKGGGEVILLALTILLILTGCLSGDVVKACMDGCAKMQTCGDDERREVFVNDSICTCKCIPK